MPASNTTGRCPLSVRTGLGESGRPRTESDFSERTSRPTKTKCPPIERPALPPCFVLIGRHLRGGLNRTREQFRGKEHKYVDLQQFIRDDEGQGLVEYALIIAVIAIAVIVAMVFLRGQIQNIFSNIGNNLT